MRVRSRHARRDEKKPEYETFEWGDNGERFWELYDAKPAREKEVFAHRYADDFREEMVRRGVFPFDAIRDVNEIRSDGLEPAWFA